jgi:hypothetical protein
MASKNKQILQRTFVEKKDFQYSKGNVNLGFTLNTGVKSELKDFKELLVQA